VNKSVSDYGSLLLTATPRLQPLLLGDNTKAPHTNNPGATHSFSIGEKNRNKNKKQRIL
jgi:hypothetical protein